MGGGKKKGGAGDVGMWSGEVGVVGGDHRGGSKTPQHGNIEEISEKLILQSVKKYSAK